MKWTVTYRKSGCKTEAIIEADSKKEVFAKIAACGISPISIREGAIERRKHSRGRAITSFVIAFLLLIVVMCVFWLRSDDVKYRSHKGDSTVLKTQNQKQSLAGKIALTLPSKVSQASAPKIEKPDVLLNPIKNLPKGFKLPKLAYENASDEFLSSLVVIKPGERFLFVPDEIEFNNLFIESMKRPLEIKPDDSDELKAEKKAVQEIKEAILGYVKDGKTPGEVVREACDEMNAIADYRDKLEENLVLILEDGDMKMAKEYQDECNENLKEYEALPLNLVDDEDIEDDPHPESTETPKSDTEVDR